MGQAMGEASGGGQQPCSCVPWPGHQPLPDLGPAPPEGPPSPTQALLSLEGPPSPPGGSGLLEEKTFRGGVRNGIAPRRSVWAGRVQRKHLLEAGLPLGLRPLRAAVSRIASRLRMVGHCWPWP